MQSTDTIIQPSVTTTGAPCKRFLFQPARHGPVHTDEHYAVIIPRAKSGSNKNNYLGLNTEWLEDKGFQTLRIEAVKLLSSIQSIADEQGHQPQQPQQHVLSRSSSATSTLVP